MKNQHSPLPVLIGIIAGGLLAVTLGGCLAGGAGYGSAPRGPLGTAGVYVDDYDYFPGYETYYSRSRHEYYYREGSSWVSRPQPRGVTPEQLRTAPSVRMDFHDSPAQHHSTVTKTYPKDWKRPEPNRAAQAAPRADKKTGPKPEPKDERKDGRNDDDKKN